MLDFFLVLLALSFLSWCWDTRPTKTIDDLVRMSRAQHPERTESEILEAVVVGCVQAGDFDLAGAANARLRKLRRAK